MHEREISILIIVTTSAMEKLLPSSYILSTWPAALISLLCTTVSIDASVDSES